MLEHPPHIGQVKLAAELAEPLRQMSAHLREAGVDLPREIERSVPQIEVGDRVGEIAHLVGQNLRRSGLYLAGSGPSTIDEVTGQMKVMYATRFVTWVDGWVTFCKYVRDEKRPVSISRQRAEEILHSDAFRSQLPVLNGINPVKLPVLRQGGKLELLRPGYDVASGLFTLQSGIDYDEDMPFDEAHALLAGLLRHFPFGDERRSRAVHIGAMLTVYCMCMLPPGARPPMFIYNANQVASGKTRLAQMALISVFGTAAVGTWSNRDEDFNKELDSAAQDFAPYLFFDDKSGVLKSGLLNAFITSSRRNGRILGTKERFDVLLRAVTFVTGNQLLYSDDLFRRSLIADLFTPVQYDQRKLPPEAIDLTEEWLMAEANRKRILAALWSLVQHSEKMERGQPAVVARKLGSFETWSRLVPPMVIHAGFGDPTEMPAATQGNPHLHEARELARLALDELVGDREMHTVTLLQLIPIARRAGLFVERLGTLENIYRELDAGRGKWKQVETFEDTLVGGMAMTRREPREAEKWAQAAEWFDRSMVTSFGSALKKLMNGLLFTNSKGWNYQFGTREGTRTATYLCTRK